MAHHMVLVTVNSSKVVFFAKKGSVPIFPGKRWAGAVLLLLLLLLLLLPLLVLLQQLLLLL